MGSVELTPEQSAAISAAVGMLGSKPLVTLGGLAGTGKTTILGEIARALRLGRLAFAAFTGKAKSVLEAKLQAVGAVEEGDFVEWRYEKGY